MNNKLQEIYDGFSKTYEENRGSFDISHILDAFYTVLNKESGALLDLGCGAGEPVARFFVDKNWQVTGVDFSEQMLTLASKYVPEMHSIRSDMLEVDFDDASFDAITASYSIFHLPKHTHVDLFKKIYRWMKPGGQVLFTYATQAYTGSEEFEGYKDFLGSELFYSHKTPIALYHDLNAIGFELESKDYHDVGGERFLWVTVKKPLT